SGPDGTTMHVGGLTRTDASGAFEAEFASLAAELRSAHQQAAQDQAAPPPAPATPTRNEGE
ncbi:MAG: hypothetical protein M3Z75_17720, partial [Actinomycetota bacterium]|nr:hypothetical protein [Actinomycetota bacterium]